jgi:dienelactone hydrolase
MNQIQNKLSRTGLVALLMMLICVSAAKAQITYSIGNVNMVLTDSTRGNRAVEVEIFYPADQSGYNVPVALPLEKKFPVIVFGHGFLIPWNSYQYIWDYLVPRGFMVVLPKTEMTLVPDHDAFAKDLSFVVNEFSRMRYQQGSMFYKKYNGKSCVMGHSMGGGAATLAAMYNPAITTLVTLAAAETSPSAIAAATNIEMPALVISGGEDCITPAASNQVPMYDNLASLCKSYINLNDATHCHFAQNFGICTLGELFCNGLPPAYQTSTMMTNYFMVSWLRYFLKYNEYALPKFQWKLSQKNSQVSYLYTCNVGSPRDGALIDDEDDFDLEASFDMNVYPNPVLSGNSISLELSTNETGEAVVVVADMIGRTVLTRTVTLHEGGAEAVELSMDGVKPGYYMVIVSNGNQKSTRSLVVE